MTLTNTYTFTIAALALGSNITFACSNWQHKDVSSFSHAQFWQAFIDKHKPTNLNELIELLVDLARCHFSPKSENWPGVQVVVSHKDAGGADQTIPITLNVGVTKIQTFQRGVRGGSWTWTHACLATSALFCQIYKDNAATECNRIPGSNGGFTQFMSTLDGWSETDQDQAEASFEAWVTANGLKARDADVSRKIKAAARATIRSRTRVTSAYSFKNVIRAVSGTPIIEADQYSKP